LGTIQGYNPEMNNKLKVWFSLIYTTYSVSLIIIVVFTIFVFFNLIMSTNPRDQLHLQFNLKHVGTKNRPLHVQSKLHL